MAHARAVGIRNPLVTLARKLEIELDERAHFRAVVQVVRGAEIDARFLHVEIQVAFPVTSDRDGSRDVEVTAGASGCDGTVTEVAVHRVELHEAAELVAVLVLFLGFRGLVRGHHLFHLRLRDRLGLGVHVLATGFRGWLLLIQHLRDKRFELSDARFQLLDAVPVRESVARTAESGRNGQAEK